MNFNSTVKGSELEGFYPAGWDFDKIDTPIEIRTVWGRHFNRCFSFSYNLYNNIRNFLFEIYFGE